MDKVQLENYTVVPANLDGSNDVFAQSSLLFAKPRWIPDCEAAICSFCAEKFTQIRRRHHCRNCGQVFCNKCCKDKLELSHLSYGEPERVCDQCKAVVLSFNKALSSEMTQKLQAAKTMSQLTKNVSGIKQLIESGGLHVLVYLSKAQHEDIRSTVLKALHNVAVHVSLHPIMATVGAVKATCRILQDNNLEQKQLLLDCMDLLALFCKTWELKRLVLTDGLDVLLKLCGCLDDTVMLYALQCLCLMVQDPDTLNTIVDSSRRNALSKITGLVDHKEERVQELSLRILVQISCGSDIHRQRIMQEEVFNGSSLSNVLRSYPTNKQILCNASCLVANLAATQLTQGTLTEQLEGLCHVMVNHTDNKDIMMHVARGINNFSKFPHNCDTIVAHLTVFIKNVLQSPNSDLQCYGFNTILSLLEYSSQSCIQELLRNGAAEFLQCLTENPYILGAVQGVVQEMVPPIAKI